MASATLTSKGQTTIPKEIREHLKLRAGDKIDFVIEPDGRVTLRPANVDIRQLDGLLAGRYKGRALSVEDMDQAIGKYLTEKYGRRKRAA
jgi:antitoxin PrlF